MSMLLISAIWISIAQAQVVKIEKRAPTMIRVEEVQPETSSTMQGASRIISPHNGAVMGRTAIVRGIAGDTSSWIAVGGSRQTVHIRSDGLFEEVVVLDSGANLIVLGAGEDTLDAVRVNSTVEKSPLRVRLTWNANTDLDLYVLQPDGNAVWFQNMSTEAGWLDIDDTDGWGPEHYTAAAMQTKGVYQVFVHYYDSYGWRQPVNFEVVISRDENLWRTYKNTLQIASKNEAGPLNAGQGESWRHIADVTVP